MGEQLMAAAASAFGELGYVSIFFLMALESSVFPVPSEAVMIPAGYLAAAGKLDPWLATLMGGLGSVAGALANYYVLGRWLGKPFLEKYGKWVLVTPEKYARGEKLFLRGANFFTFVGRFIPVVRHVISIPAGIFRMPLVPFLLLTWAGATLWCGALVAAGWFFGERTVALFAQYAHLAGYALAAVAVGLASKVALAAAARRFGRWAYLAAVGVVLAALYAAGFWAIPELERVSAFPKAGYAAMALGAERVTLTGSSGLPIAAAYTGAARNGTVLYFHGNGQPLALLEGHLRFFTDLGYAVFAPDYPGYGESVGTPTEASVLDAADKAYAYLTAARKVSPESIIVAGFSIGTGPAADVASRKPVGGLVLIAPYASLQGVARSLYGFAPQRLWLLPDVFDTLSRAPKIVAPTLVIHGDSDFTIPQTQGKEVYTALGSVRKSFADLPGAGHNAPLRERTADSAAAWRAFFGTK